MSKWLGNGPHDPGDTTSSTEDENTTNTDTGSHLKWFSATESTAHGDDTAGTDAETQDDDARPDSTAPSYLSAVPVTTGEPAETHRTPASPKKPRREKSKRKQGWGHTTRTDKSLTRSSQPVRQKRSLPSVPRWAKITGVAVLAVGVVGAAAKVGADRFGSDDSPVLAGDQAADLVTDPTETPSATSAAPEEDGTGWTDRGDLPYESTPVVSGQCDPGDGEERIRPSSKSLRSTVATFYDEYRAHNAKGIGATLDEESSMKEQNWGAVFDQLDPDATWCVRMDADEGIRVDIQVRMTVDGHDTVFEQTATGTEKDGQWKILEIEERK